MKFIAVTLLALIAAVASAPTSISDNNVGDIITVGINANVELSNHVEQNIISVILAYLNQQAIVVGRPGGNAGEDLPAQPFPKITPEMIERVKSLMTKA